MLCAPRLAPLPALPALVLPTGLRCYLLGSPPAWAPRSVCTSGGLPLLASLLLTHGRGLMMMSLGVSVAATRRWSPLQRPAQGLAGGQTNSGRLLCVHSPTPARNPHGVHLLSMEMGWPRSHLAASVGAVVGVTTPGCLCRSHTCSFPAWGAPPSGQKRPSPSRCLCSRGRPAPRGGQSHFVEGPAWPASRRHGRRLADEGFLCDDFFLN